MASGDITSNLQTPSEFLCNSFDGVDDYVEIPHAAQQLGANLSNGFTISAWINPKTLGESSTGRIFDKSTAGGGVGGWCFQLNTNNRLQFYINNGTAASSANSAFSLNSWSHVLLTVTNAQLTNIYVNGVLSGTADQDLIQTIATITTTQAVRIANRGGATTVTFDGCIRSVKMWNRVLSTDEITEEYNGKEHPTGLIHYFKLGGDYHDYGSVGVDATNSGSTPVNSLTSGITADMRMNLATVTDKLIVVPVKGRDQKIKIIKAEREA